MNSQTKHLSALEQDLDDGEELTPYETYLKDRVSEAGLEIFELTAENRNLRHELGRALEQLAYVTASREKELSILEALQTQLWKEGWYNK